MNELMIEQFAAENGRPFCNPNTCERLRVSQELAAKMAERRQRAERIENAVRESHDGKHKTLVTDELLEQMRIHNMLLKRIERSRVDLEKPREDTCYNIFGTCPRCGADDNICGSNFCSTCGRPLTDEGVWAMLARITEIMGDDGHGNNV